MATVSSFILLIIFASVSPQLVPGQSATSPTPMGEICMGCICEAASRCDRTLSCHDGVCGLFAITKPYWTDAGKPTIKGDDVKRQGAFERCTLDPVCAAKTVQGYMSQYSQDCDGNGVVNCHDFAALHSLGAGCQGELDQDYKERLDTCLRKLEQAQT